MNIKKQILLYSRLICTILAVCLMFTSCSRSEYECQDCIVQYTPSDPKQLTPFNSIDPSAKVIQQYLFQTLVQFDYRTHEFVPVLAKNLPVFNKKRNGKIEATFEIREEATWDNGQPITGHDVAFSLKVIKCPTTDNGYLMTDFAPLENIVVDKQNAKRFTIIYAYPSMNAASALTDLLIIPPSIYDPKGLLSNYSVYELTEQADDLALDPNLVQYGEFYNGPSFQKSIISGSGPYRLLLWNANERLVLKLKEKWWGNQIKEASNQWFQAFPKEIVAEIYDSPEAGAKALRKEKLDAMNGIPFNTFAKYWYPESGKYRTNFEVFKTPSFSYEYIGINLRSPKLNNPLVRQALAHLMDVDRLINEYCYGFAQRVSSFTHLSKKEYLHPDIQPYPFDTLVADSLLTLAGWVDADSNGVREFRVNDSTVIELSLTINYNEGNERRRQTCLILKEVAALYGIKINIVSLEVSTLLTNLKKQEFELYVGGWVASSKESDPKEIWHTTSIGSGSNYVGFGNEKTDSLINALRKEIYPERRVPYYQALHQIIHTEVPYIFLLTQDNCVAIHKKFKNAYPASFSPGYWSPGLLLTKE